MSDGTSQLKTTFPFTTVLTGAVGVAGTVAQSMEMISDGSEYPNEFLASTVN